MSTPTAKWRQLSAMPTSSRGLLGIMKMCSLCRLCGVARALCPARPGPARLTPSDPRNHRIAESPNRQGAHSDRIANREALQRDSARFNQPQDWQGRGGSPTSAPRPATPGEISDPRPRATRAARPGPEICQDRDFNFFLLAYKWIHSLVNYPVKIYIFDINLRPIFGSSGEEIQ